MKTNVKKQKNVTGKNIDTNYGRRETMVFKENVTKFAIWIFVKSEAFFKCFMTILCKFSSLSTAILKDFFKCP